MKYEIGTPEFYLDYLKSQPCIEMESEFFDEISVEEYMIPAYWEEKKYGDYANHVIISSKTEGDKFIFVQKYSETLVTLDDKKSQLTETKKQLTEWYNKQKGEKVNV